MSGKKPTGTALVRRTRPDLSDADLASLIFRTNHFFDGRRLTASFVVEKDARMHVPGAVPGRSYLIYCENVQRFIGAITGGSFEITPPPGHERLSLRLYPMADA